MVIVGAFQSSVRRYFKNKKNKEYRKGTLLKRQVAAINGTPTTPQNMPRWEYICEFFSFLASAINPPAIFETAPPMPTSSAYSTLNSALRVGNTFR